MKHEKELNEIKTYEKVYFTFTTWDNFSRRLNPFTYQLENSNDVVNKIIARLPSVCAVEIKHDDDYPYPLVRAHL